MDSPQSFEELEIAQAKKTIPYSSDEISDILSITSINFLKRCQKDFKFFAERMFGLSMDKPHLESVETLERDNFVLAEMHRGAGKSELYTKSYPVWCLLRTIDLDNILTKPFPKQEDTLVISASQDQSSMMLEDIKSRIISNPIFRILFLPEKLSDTKWTAEEVMFRNGCKIKSKALTPTARGFHGHRVIVDDLLKDTESKQVEETLINRFFSIVFPTIFAKFSDKETGKLLVVGTPQTDTDLLRRLEAKLDPKNGKPMFTHLRYPAVQTDSEGNWLEPSVPSRFSHEKLKLIQSTMPPDLWAREYMLIPVDSTNSYFNHNIINQQLHDPVNPNKYDNKHAYYLGIDIALSQADTADFTVFTILEVNYETNTSHLIKMHRQKGMTEDEIMRLIESFNDLYHFNSILIEKAPISYGMCDRITQELSLGNIYFYIPTEKERTRILSQLRTNLNSGSLYLLNNEILIDELRKFKTIRDNSGKWKVQGVGAHDDIVISLSLAVEAMLKYGGSVSGETLDDENLQKHINSFSEDEQKTMYDEALKTRLNEQLFGGL